MTALLPNIKQGENGYHICCSNPRPPKASGGGPKEGGVAILSKTAAPNVVAAQCPVATLSADDALHSIIPIDHNFSVHVIVAYCPKPSEELRSSLFRYAASLGDVPIIIGADWNVEASESRAVAEALSTGCWVDAAVLLANTGDSQATDVAQAPTTHRAGTQGRRVDYFLVNAAAQPIISEVFIVKDLPLVNHFAVGLRLTTPTDMTYQRIQPTRTYFKTPATKDQAESVHQAWRAAFHTQQQHWNSASFQGDVDGMWDIWTRTAETALSQATGLLTDRPKGSKPCFQTRTICTNQSSCKQHKQNLLAKTQLRINRLKTIQRSGSSHLAESPCRVQALGSKIRDAFSGFVELPHGFDFSDTHALQNQLDKVRTDYETLAKHRRIAAWQERVTSNLAAACRWVKGEAPALAMLDTPNGPTAHPQHMADELLRRSREQFGARPDNNKRTQFFTQCGHLLKTQPCELPVIAPAELRRLLLRKASAASGLDGWNTHELGRTTC